MKNKIPYGGHYIDNSDVSSVLKSLKGKLITTGKFVDKFENKVKKNLKSKYVLSCNSGTSALHLSFCAAGLKEGDVVIMPSINFISAYSMATSFGAKIFLTDVDPQTGQMTPKNLLECIKKFKLKKIKIILTMYMGGYPENVYDFYKIKKKFSSILIEDACHAFGAKYLVNNKYYPVGSCKHADISTFSLHPLKPITTGEGGLLSTNNKKYFNLAKTFRSHGIIRSKNHWNYDIQKAGYNYRISDINCALGVSQLKKIKIFFQKRKKIYDYYKKELNGFKNLVSFPKYSKNIKPSYHLIIININFKKLNDKEKFIEYILRKNIIFQFHYKPIFTFTVYDGAKQKYPSAIKYYNTSLSIPIFHQISLKEVKYIIKIIKKYISKY